jgi:hypothetical protein
MEKQLILRIDESLKDKFTRVARKEGKTASEKIREMITEYTVKNDFSTVVDDLWTRVSEKIESNGFKEKDINKAIQEVRHKKY